MKEIILIAKIYSKLHLKNYDLYLESLKQLEGGATVINLLEDPGNPYLHFWYQQRGQGAVRALSDDIEAGLQGGLTWLWLGHPDYPQDFYGLEYPPFCLSYIGKPAWKRGSFISVVGSREPNPESIQWMQAQLPSLLHAYQLGVVSGGARGIDQAAHKVSVRSGQPTVILVPSGLNKLYPDQLKDWVNIVCEMDGAIMSEYDYSAEMNKGYFQQRNRLIASLGVATLILDARRRSGTMITARAAADQGKSVYVMPSHARDCRGWGGLDLILEGASFVRDSSDLITFVGQDLNRIKSLTRPIVGCELGHH